MKLNLASGQMYLEGYINIDNMSMYDGSMKVDKQADIFTLEWEDNTVDEIILSHFKLEHFSRALDALSILVVLVLVFILKIKIIIKIDLAYNL